MGKPSVRQNDEIPLYGKQRLHVCFHGRHARGLRPSEKWFSFQLARPDASNPTSASSRVRVFATLVASSRRRREIVDG
jgi:hypothetical protein